MVSIHQLLKLVMILILGFSLATIAAERTQHHDISTKVAKPKPTIRSLGPVARLRMYRRLLIKQIRRYMTESDDVAVVESLKTLIKLEKIARLRICMRSFGYDSCVLHSANPRPFFIWKQLVIRDLLKDPTEEIIKSMRSDATR